MATSIGQLRVRWWNDSRHSQDHRDSAVMRNEVGAWGALPNALAQQQCELLPDEDANPA